MDDIDERMARTDCILALDDQAFWLWAIEEIRDLMTHAINGEMTMIADKINDFSKLFCYRQSMGQIKKQK